MPVKIFFCYAHEDEPLLNKLKTHLKPLQRMGLINVWHDRDISAGLKWEEEIDKHLNEANIILLLVSPDFMESDYCYGKEMQRALERAQRGEARVIPIILRPVYWQGVLGTLQALPTDAKPVMSSSWQYEDEAFYNVTEGIRKVVEAAPKEFSLIATLKKHTHDVTSLAFSPNGQVLASGSRDNSIALWNPKLRELLLSFNGHSGTIWGLAFSPDGNTLVSGSVDKTVKLWETNTGKELATLKGHSRSVFALAFSPDGQTLVSSSEDTTIRLWNLSTRKLQSIHRSHLEEIYSLAFSPDGHMFASGSGDDTIKIWKKKLADVL